MVVDILECKSIVIMEPWKLRDDSGSADKLLIKVL